jgi:predicted TIM-barrel fold metal-dependent hydrolase
MIDIHTHLHPPRLFAAIRRWFAERSDWDLSDKPTEPADVAAVLRAAGVERFVFFSYAHKPGMAREINAWLAQTSRELGRYGVPLATIHPDDPDPLADIRTALDDGCIGLKFHEDVQAVAVDDVRLAPIFAEMAARGAFLLVHVGPIPWSYPPSVGLARVRRVLESHPGLNVVVAHMGAPDTNAYFDLMATFPRLYLDTTMVFAPGTSLHRASEVDRALLGAHANRVTYGTDFPNVPYAYESEGNGLRALALPEPELRAILHDNAARLLLEAGIA